MAKSTKPKKVNIKKTTKSRVEKPKKTEKAEMPKEEPKIETPKETEPKKIMDGNAEVIEIIEERPNEKLCRMSDGTTRWVDISKFNKEEEI